MYSKNVFRIEKGKPLEQPSQNIRCVIFKLYDKKKIVTTKKPLIQVTGPAQKQNGVIHRFRNTEKHQQNCDKKAETKQRTTIASKKESKQMVKPKGNKKEEDSNSNSSSSLSSF